MRFDINDRQTFWPVEFYVKLENIFWLVRCNEWNTPSNKWNNSGEAKRWLAKNKFFRKKTAYSSVRFCSWKKKEAENGLQFVQLAIANKKCLRSFEIVTSFEEADDINWPAYVRLVPNLQYVIFSSTTTIAFQMKWTLIFHKDIFIVQNIHLAYV